MVPQELRENPKISANFLSKMTFSYIISLLIQGWKRQLDEGDLYEPLPDHKAKVVIEAFTRVWKKEVVQAEKIGRPRSLFRAIMRNYLRRAALLGILLFIEECIWLLQAMVIGRLIRYFKANSSLTVSDAYVAAAVLTFSGFFAPFLHHPYFCGMEELGMKLKIAACGVVMQKGLRLTCGALHRMTVGHIVTIMSTDVAKFEVLFLFINYLWIGPILLAAYLYLLWSTIGVSCIIGFVTLILFVPVQSFFSHQIGRYRKLLASQTDRRLSIMNEILSAIRVVKMYAWEDAFANVIADWRKKEVIYIKKNNIWQSLVMGTFWGSTKVIILGVILTYLFLGNELDSEQTFVMAALFVSCQLPLMVFVPFALQNIFESKVSFSRIQALLELEEFEKLQDSYHPKRFLEKASRSIEIMITNNSDHHNYSTFITVEGLSATWEEEDTARPLLAVKNISFKARNGDLIMVTGPVGSGKSSLLFSLLRETKLTSGKLEMHGRVAYVSQDPWLFSGTVRENILFGKSFDEERYREAVDVCCLRKDLSQLPFGDLSAVGDRGASLSGGQKARISLARAVYSNADIYLLDDPLSAVDAAVARYLFKRCITGFLKTKLTILVTHQMQFLHSASLVILMHNGHAVVSGTVEELKDMNTFLDIIEETERSYSCLSSSYDPCALYTPFEKLEFYKSVVEDEDEKETFFLAPEEFSPLTVATSSLNSQTEINGMDKRMPKPEFRWLQSKSPSLSSGISEISLNMLSKDIRIFSMLVTTSIVSCLVLLRAFYVKVTYLSPHTNIQGDDDEIKGIDQEDRLTGEVSWRIYFLYVKAMTTPCFILLLACVSAIGVQILNNVVDWWLNKWSTASGKAKLFNTTSSEDAFFAENNFVDTIDFWFFNVKVTLNEYRNGFTVMVFILMFLSVLRCIWFRLAQVNGAQSLHDQMFEALIRSPMVFFDRNPIGRILNRFSKDVGMMDDQLSYVFFDYLMGLLEIVGIIMVIFFLNPVVFVPFVPLCIVSWLLQRFYLASSRAIKRLEATTRSPLYSHVSAILRGLPTIRSFKNQQLAMDKFCHYQDRNSAALFLGITAARWVALMIDWIIALFIAVVVFSCILFAGEVPLKDGEVGLMLVYVVQLTGFVSWMLRESAEVENGMVSIERITSYTELPRENTNEGFFPPAAWPYAGEILFENVSLQYEPDGPRILKNLSFQILPKEKIGVVGRTAAGKSSLLGVLFRLYEPNGEIVIDGLNIKKVLLNELRRRLSIIPQDPVLFIGSLRRNLDPFSNYSEDDVWSALEQVELKSFISNLPDGLETCIKEGGVNFSVGQRQLICLARAILKRPKILVIDEATANVDPITDNLIQKTIKASFANSTVITVAHRLHTIMDSDKIMVLDDGRLIEFDHPYILLSDKFGALSSLVSETGEETSRLLKKLAAVSYKVKH